MARGHVRPPLSIPRPPCLPAPRLSAPLAHPAGLYLAPSDGKMMDYDPMGDTYSVMTKAGPKHFVERDDITVEVLENPSGGCAQQ